MLNWLFGPKTTPAPAREGGDHMANVTFLTALADERDGHLDSLGAWEAENLRRIAGEYRALVEGKTDERA